MCQVGFHFTAPTSYRCRFAEVEAQGSEVQNKYVEEYLYCLHPPSMKFCCLSATTTSSFKNALSCLVLGSSTHVDQHTIY